MNMESRNHINPGRPKHILSFIQHLFRCTFFNLFKVEFLTSLIHLFVCMETLKFIIMNLNRGPSFVVLPKNINLQDRKFIRETFYNFLLILKIF